eukprot:Rhum_TRINITY_DN14728_c0_g1::Rhum_TRINITY_DN14728_c0_g1_i2::g.111719::m.111719
MPIKRKNKEGSTEGEEAAASPDGAAATATAVTAATSSEVTTTKRTLNRKGRGGKSTTETVTETEIVVEEAAAGSCAEELKKLKKEMEAKERMITMLKERAKEEEEAKEKEEARVSELLFKMEELEALVDSKVIGAVSEEAAKNEPIVKSLRDDIREGRLELKAVKDAWKLNRQAWAKKWGETQELYMLSAHFHPWYFFFKTGSARGIRADASKKSVTINEASLTKKGNGGNDGDRGGGGSSKSSKKNRRSRRDDSDSGSGDDSGSSDSTRQGRRGGGSSRGGRRRRRDEERNPIETLFGERGEPHRMTRGISPLAQRILETRSRSPTQPAYPTLFPPTPSRHSPYHSAQGSPPPPHHDGGYPASSLGTGMDNLAIQHMPQTRVVHPHHHGSSPYPYDDRAGSPLDEHQRTPPHATYGNRSPSPGPSHTPYTGHVLNGLRGSSVPVYDGQRRGSPAGFVHPDPHGFEHAAPHGGATSANTSGIYVPGGDDGSGWPLEESMLRPDRIINSDNSNLYHIPSIMAPSPLGRTSTTQPAPRSGAVSYAGDDYVPSGRSTSSPKPLDPVFRSEVMPSPLNSRVSDLPSTGRSQSHAAPSVDLGTGKRRAARAAAASAHPAGAVCAEKAAGGHEVFSGSLRADLLPIAARLSALYKAKNGTVLDELAANLVSDVSLSSTAKDSSRQLHKEIFAEAATELVQTKSGQYPGASELDLLLMRLYTMAGPDIDKLMLFDDVPEFSASPLSEWASYKKTHKDRNTAIFSQINRALRQVASDDAAEESKGWATLGKWVKTTCHLHRMCYNVQSTHDATSEPLMRGVTGLPPTAVSEHTSLQAQQEITWPAPSSCTSNQSVAIDAVMGNATASSSHPSSVLFSVSGRVPALHLQHISQYPAEAEVLMPPLSVLSVRSTAPHSPDPSCHSLSLEWDHSVPLAGLDEPLRADEQLSSQALAGPGGSTRMGVPAPYTPTHGDRDAAASLLFRQRSCFASPQPSRAASRYDDPTAPSRTPQNSRAASRAHLSERLPGDGPADSETAALLLSCQQVAFDTAAAPRDDDILASHGKGSVSSRIPFVASVLGEPGQGGSDEHTGAAAAQPPSGAESSLASRPVHPSFASHAGYEDSSLALSQTQPHDGRLRHTGGGGRTRGGGEPVSPLTPARLRGDSTISALSAPRSMLSRSGHRDSLAVSPVGETQDYYFKTPQRRSGRSGGGRGPSSIRSADSAFSQVRGSQQGSPAAPRSGGSLRSRRANSVGRERSPSTRSLRVALETSGDGRSPEGRGSPLQYRMAHLHRGVEVRLTGAAADEGGCLRGDETGFVIERDEWCPLRPFCVKGPRYDVFWYRAADIELCDGQEGADGPRSELSFDEKLALVMPPSATRSPATTQRAPQAGNAGQGQGSPLRDRMPEVQRGVHVQLTEAAEPGGSLVHGELGVVVERDEWCPFRPFCVKGPRYDVHWYRAVDILVVPHP